MLSVCLDAVKRLTTAVLVTGLLVGCSVIPTSKVPVELPPTALLQECPIPEATVATNGQLAQWALSLKYALKLCNDDKAALREWADSVDSSAATR